MSFRFRRKRTALLSILGLAFFGMVTGGMLWYVTGAENLSATVSEAADPCEEEYSNTAKQNQCKNLRTTIEDKKKREDNVDPETKYNPCAADPGSCECLYSNAAKVSQCQHARDADEGVGSKPIGGCTANCNCSCGWACADGGSQGCYSICKTNCGDTPFYETDPIGTTHVKADSEEKCDHKTDALGRNITKFITCDNDDYGGGYCVTGGSVGDENFILDSTFCNKYLDQIAGEGVNGGIASYSYCPGQFTYEGGCAENPIKYTKSGFQFPDCFCGVIQIDIPGVGFQSKMMQCGCGDTSVDPRVKEEELEDPYTPSSSSRCGDGILDLGEQCDDGNNIDGDGCDADCTITTPITCGNGVIDDGEQCDPPSSPTDACAYGDTCLDNCQCPLPDPGFSITKISSEICEEEAITYAAVNYTIAVTNNGSTIGTISQINDVLDSVVQREWIQDATVTPTTGLTISDGSITWDLEGDAQTFDPGEQMTFTYRIHVPLESFGNFENVATAIIEDDGYEDISVLNNTNVDCETDTPITGLMDSVVARVIFASVLIIGGGIYLYTDKLDSSLLQHTGIHRKRSKFEDKIDKS